MLARVKNLSSVFVQSNQYSLIPPHKLPLSLLLLENSLFRKLAFGWKKNKINLDVKYDDRSTKASKSGVLSKNSLKKLE